MKNITFWSTANSVFGPKGSPASVVGGLPNSNHHDPWNRLHGGPSAFPPGPSWAKGVDKRDERDRGKDVERRDIPHIKDEKDRYEHSTDFNATLKCNGKTLGFQCIVQAISLFYIWICIIIVRQFTSKNSSIHSYMQCLISYL